MRSSPALALVGLFPGGHRRWLVLALLGAAFLAGLAGPSLWDQDEAAYAGFARRMLATGDWVVPAFEWSEVHRKPPLLFWAIASSFAVFGESEWSLRLPGLLAVIFTCVAVATLGRSLFGPRVASVGALVLATSLFVPALGKVAVTDSLLLLAETVAVFALHRALATPALRWTALFWVAVAAGCLAKGPPILVLAGGLGAFLLVFHPQRRSVVRLHPWLFGPLALAPLAAWGWLAWQRTDGALVRWMLDWYVLHRATKAVFGQTGPPGYFLVSFLLGLFPWIALLPAAFVRAWRERREGTGVFVVGWLAFGWLFWELMASKLPTYALGAYPLLALLIARELVERPAGAPTKADRLGAVLLAGVAGLLGVALVVAAVVLPFEALVPAALGMAAVVLAGVLPAASMVHKGLFSLAFSRLVLAGPAIAIAAWVAVVPRLEPYRAFPRQVATELLSLAPPGTPLVFARNFGLPSLVFYAAADGRPVTTLAAGAGPGGPCVLLFDDRDSARFEALTRGRPARRIEGWSIERLQPRALNAVWIAR